MREAILVGTSLDISVLIERLAAQLDRDELLEFIKKLDLEVSDWDFTNRLTAYFDDQKVVYENEK